MARFSSLPFSLPPLLPFFPFSSSSSSSTSSPPPCHPLSPPPFPPPPLPPHLSNSCGSSEGEFGHQLTASEGLPHCRGGLAAASEYIEHARRNTSLTRELGTGEGRGEMSITFMLVITDEPLQVPVHRMASPPRVSQQLYTLQPMQLPLFLLSLQWGSSRG